MQPNEITLTTDSPEETRRVGAALASQLPSGVVVVLLIGPLGGGKTTFTQGLAEGLGILQTVTSPSFLLMKEYTSGSRILRHLDIFRLSQAEELRPVGLTEDLPADCVVAVEWADRFSLPIDAPTVVVEFSFAEEEHQRSITVSGEGMASKTGPEGLIHALRSP